MRSLWLTLHMLALCSVLPAQEASFRLVGASGIPGLPVVCRIAMDHTSDCEAFSLGVSHDPSLLSISSLQRGFYLEGANLGGVSPDFLMLETDLLSGTGFVVGCLFDLSPPIVDLLAGLDQEILICTYQVLPTAVAGDTPLQFSISLYDPPVAMLVVMDGVEFTPTWEDGVITILSDCNLNGIPDGTDLANGTSVDCDLDGILDSCELAAGTGFDSNGNGVLDTCDGPLFWRGDCNNSGSLDLADAIASLYYLFGLANFVTCIDSCDVNDSGAVDIADTVFFLEGLFSNGPLPFAPYPACGFDPTADPLGCASFQSACP
ncbi:MAG: hypothetical protein OSB09_06445 [Planctomycetota bacterium]|nr:hypothetical protein [Planctomycetota bacterium]